MAGNGSKKSPKTKGSATRPSSSKLTTSKKKHSAAKREKQTSSVSNSGAISVTRTKDQAYYARYVRLAMPHPLKLNFLGVVQK